MRVEQVLHELTDHSQKRLVLLKALGEECRSLSGPERERLVSNIVVEMTNLWAAFCRHYFLSTAMGCRDTSGNPIPIASARPQTMEEAMTYAIYANKPWYRKSARQPPWTWWDEPSWHSTRQFTAAMRAINPGNMSAVTAGLATTSRVFTDLPTFRNFFAHKGKDTRMGVVAVAKYYALSPRLRPHELLMSSSAGRPQPLLLDFVDDLMISIGLMRV